MKKLLILLFFLMIGGCEKPPQKIALLETNEGHRHIVITDEGLKTCWLCNYKGIKKYIRKGRER